MGPETLKAINKVSATLLPLRWILVFSLVTPVMSFAQDKPSTNPKSSLEPAEEWCQADEPLVDPEGIKGTLIIVGGGSIPEVALEVLEAAIGSDGKLVVITAASAEREAAGKRATTLLQQAGISNIVVAPELEDAAEECQQLASQIANARAVWICGGQQGHLAERYQATQVETALLELVGRGGVVAGTSAGAAIMSRVMIASGSESPNIEQGFDLLPGSIIDQHFSERNRIGRSRLAVANHPGNVGVGIDEATALLVRGRTMRVIGEGSVTFLQGPCSFRSAEEIKVDSGELVDWVQLRRAAKERAGNHDPGLPRFGQTKVDSGSLVIVGGGGLPKEIVDKFISLAGGQNAHIVILPTAVPPEMAARAEIPDFLEKADVASVIMLPQMGVDAVSDPQFKDALEKATGVWFGGGRQWNFVDAYDGSEAVRLFHNVLRRGGVIGGSSAGATIQGEFLVRGHPLGNTVMMAEGYQRGFAFLPAAAIDQHFSQRRRQDDLISVIEKHPKLLGIGIDEATALVVQGNKGEVLGKNAVHFMTADRLPSREYLTVRSGESIDLPIPNDGNP